MAGLSGQRRPLHQRGGCNSSKGLPFARAFVFISGAGLSARLCLPLYSNPRIFLNVWPSLPWIVENILRLFEKLLFITNNAIKIFILPYAVVSSILSLKATSSVGFPRVHNILQTIFT